MANMGSTGTVNITKAMMDAAIKAVDDYQSQVQELTVSFNLKLTDLFQAVFRVQQLMVLRLFTIQVFFQMLLIILQKCLTHSKKFVTQ